MKQFTKTITLVILLTITLGIKTHAAEIYVVSKDGSGDFTTIQEGVDFAQDGDTLIIYPGVYTEDVSVMGKELNITGISKELCILKYDTASYRKIPLTISAGKVSNITIYGMDSGIGQAELTAEEIALINAELIGDSWERQKNFKGYAVHIDQNYLYGRELCFENCKIISENNHCVGIGMRGNGSVSFNGCELISAGSGSCIYLHNTKETSMDGNSFFSMSDCSLTSYQCPYVLSFSSLSPYNNDVYMTFKNNHIRAVAYANAGGYDYFNVNTGFDVETLLSLETQNVFEAFGFVSPISKIVHEMEPDTVKKYIEILEKPHWGGIIFDMLSIELPEGITCIGKISSDAKTDQENVKRQVIAVYNSNNAPGIGWCGLDNFYLTAESFGNTLPEMNMRLPLY